MTTLDNSFCRPTNEELGQIMTPLKMSADENHVLVAYTINGKKHKFYRRWVDVADIGLTEIPVSRFLDLYHDRITPWRLEDVGFDVTVLPYKNKIEGHYQRHIMEVTETGQLIFLNGKMMEGITTFTELLQQIKFLTPPQK
jgi:hypothetical protein